MNKVLRVYNRGFPYNQKYSSYGQLFGCLNHGNLNAHQRKWSTAEQAQNYKYATQILLLANSYLPLPIDNELHIAFTKYLNTTLTWLKTGIQNPYRYFERAKPQVRGKAFDVLSNREIVNKDFLDMSKEDLMQAGLEMGPALRLAKEVQAFKDNTKRSFSSYKSLSENKKYGPVADSNEVMRCKYILSILHTAISLLKDLLILPQVTVTGAENSGRKKRKADEAFDYGYEYVYGIVTIGIFCTSKTEYRISLTEDALNDQTEREEDFRGYSRLAKG
ncbi:10437_t:CDS:2 [Funneliformis caledonium]|uniref:10437_t:CDS:1 n=1 Tax=Funneliformis caledonium TaxID=1117310 RepID=A0A9N9BMI6_9GLOM|nr:10437_t:CDS:2 [Funneliformis caledonium]